MVILLVGILAVALMCLYPPWKRDIVLSNGTTSRPAGYASILNPPEPPSNRSAISIDLSRLGVQVGATMLLTLGVVIALRTQGRR